MAFIDSSFRLHWSIKNAEGIRCPRSPGNSYHVAASDPDRCAQETLAFIDDVSPTA